MSTGAPKATSEDDQGDLLESGVNDLVEALDELEAELPPEEVDAWVMTFLRAARVSETGA